MRTPFQVIIPGRLSRRGEGLGNELVPWAKAFLASRALGLRMRPKTWGLNRRGYRHLFHTARTDWLWEAAQCALLPRLEFTADDYQQTGIVDYGMAIRTWAERTGLRSRRAFALVTGGMFGGYLAIRQARDFLTSQLLASRDALGNLHELRSSCPTGHALIAVHIRLGDFAPAGAAEQQRTRFNTSLPLAWYARICRNLQKSLHGRVRFAIFTDSWTPEVVDLAEELSAVTSRQHKNPACSDLLLMAGADCLVCSVSSFSLSAAFLGDQPYLWYEPQLGLTAGTYSLWGHEAWQQEPESPTMRNRRTLLAQDVAPASQGRGVPVGIDGALPDGLIGRIRARVDARRIQDDLIYYGVIPSPVTSDKGIP